MVPGAGEVDHVEAGHLRVPHQLEEGLVALLKVHLGVDLSGLLLRRLIVLPQLLLLLRVEDEVEAVRAVSRLERFAFHKNVLFVQVHPVLFKRNTLQ